MMIAFLLAGFTAISAHAQNHPRLDRDAVFWMDNTSRVYEVSRNDGLKTYYLKTDAPLRDNTPANKEVRIDEAHHLPYTRTGSSLFDSLFALALTEIQQSSVTTIRDGSFADAACDCFETGEKWHYVWTRDTAYAADLGLATVNPERTRNSLAFKLSGFRQNLGTGEQVVQDTGSGGSWPVSTDRVVWSLGAFEVLKHLPYQSASYNSFLGRSYRALKNTVMTDRLAIFDATDGLYTGEQSFLDWREQSYPEWTATKVVHIGMSKSLSTNVVHYMTLVRLSELADELNESQDGQTFRSWAQNLKTAIRQSFWDGKSFRSLKLTFLDQRAIKSYDLLGVSLAVISGVASPDEARSALNAYPHTLVGAPVIWPQHQDVPIYHNRAIWPFVSAYALKAAKVIQDPHLITAFARSLMIGPAQNLSHMENYEFTTLRNYYGDGRLSGPVVNSRRQLWSLGGYVGFVVDVIFGKETRLNGVRFNPSLTAGMARELFAQSSALHLKNLSFQGRKFDVTLSLPQLPASGEAILPVVSLSLNGKALRPGEWIEPGSLAKNGANDLKITLGTPLNFPPSRMIRLQGGDGPYRLSGKTRESLFAPKTPILAPVGLSDDAPLLSFHTPDFGGVRYRIYKNGQFLAETTESYYQDQGQPLDQTACYSVTAEYNSENESFPSEPSCFWPTSSIQHYPVTGPNVRANGGTQVASANGRIYLHEWGAPGQTLELSKVVPSRSGVFALQLEYVNNERINTGITGGVKKLTVINNQSKEIVKSAVVMLPQHEGSFTDSSFVQVELKQNVSYAILIEDFFNMSYFNHFSSYKGRGGSSGAYNQFHFAEVKLLYLGSRK